MPPSCSAKRVIEGVVLVTAAACLTAGCRPACDPSPDANTPEIYTGGVSAGGAYATGPWAGPHLHFPGGKRWNLEHRLGFTPRRVGVYVAIPADSRELTPCAGNTCVFCVDDQYVWLRNDTCAEFWVRVEADGQGPATLARRCDDQAAPGEDAAGDSGASDGAARDETVLGAPFVEGGASGDGSGTDGSLSEAAPIREGSDAALMAEGNDAAAAAF